MLDFAKLVSSLPGGVAQGLIWGIMAIGVYLTYKILDIADLTVDGTMCTGGAGAGPGLLPHPFHYLHRHVLYRSGPPDHGVGIRAHQSP